MNAAVNVKEKLIVPLDVEGLATAEALVEALAGTVGMFKIGHQLFTRVGPAAVEMVQARGEQVFLDLKFHDIPNTVAGGVRSATRLGVRMLNVHASGGMAMMRAAAESAQEQAEQRNLPKPIVLAVTLLTSLGESDLEQMLACRRPVRDQVLYLAQAAQCAGLNGVVASPHETEAIREACGPEFVIVTPGVRPKGTATQDQKRVMTPAEAVAAGADYLVIGRPIHAAPDPRRAAQQILNELMSNGVEHART